MGMADNKNCINRHCNMETYGSMSFLTIYIVILFVLSTFAFICLMFG